MRNFMKDMENSGNLNLEPVFDNFSFQQTFLNNEGNLKLFKSLVSSHPHQMVRILKLNFKEAGSTVIPKKDWADLKLPGLEELYFQVKYEYELIPYSADADPESINLLEVLLKGAKTTLTKLKVSYDSPCPKKGHTRYADIISKYCPKPVEKLYLEMALNDDQIEGIIGLNLTLVELFCLRYEALGISKQGVINRLIHQQKESLVELTLNDSIIECRSLRGLSKCYKEVVSRISFVQTVTLDFPTFKKLEVLRIQGDSILSFSYPERFPVLKTLIIDRTEVEVTGSMLESSVPCETLRTLVFIPFSTEQKSLIPRVQRGFPNVKKLQIELPFDDVDGNEFMSCVFKDFTHLEELVVNITKGGIGFDIQYWDSVITGISEDECKKLRGMESSCLASVKESDLVRGPSIINMTKLKKFTIYDDWYVTLLTDISAIFRFLKVDSLKEVELHRFEFSSNVLDKMKEKVKFSAVPTEYDQERPNYSRLL